jgi:hypothetical protein
VAQHSLLKNKKHNKHATQQEITMNSGHRFHVPTLHAFIQAVFTRWEAMIRRRGWWPII